MTHTAATAILLAIIAVLYLLPTILAYGRDHPHRQRLALVNILFGWTLLGWIGVFLWATLATSDPREA